MNAIASQRLMRELKDFAAEGDDPKTSGGVKLIVHEDQINRLSGTIKGPPDTPYQGGTFEVEIRIPDNYPFYAPEIRFLTKVWHPNISSQTGVICLDILKDQWAASMTIRTVLLSVQSLLNSPEPNDPQDAVVANQCIHKKQLFQQTATYWSQIYASAPGDKMADFENKMRRMMEFGGCGLDKALSILSCNNWDLQASLDEHTSGDSK